MIHERIVPGWDVIKGEYFAETATVKGMGDIRGWPRADFERAIKDALPKDTKVVFDYGDDAPDAPPVFRAA